MVGTEPSWTTIPGKAGAINHNVCRKTYEKQILESNIPWHTGYPIERSPSPRPRSPLPRSDQWGNDRLAKRNGTGSWGSCSTSSSLGRQDTNRAAMQTSRGVWRDLPTGRHGLQSSGRRSENPFAVPFDVDFAGRRIPAKEVVLSDQLTSRRSLSPARVRYMMEMSESGPCRELAPARQRVKAKPRSLSPTAGPSMERSVSPPQKQWQQAAGRPFSPPPPSVCSRRDASPEGEDQALAASQSQLGSWMSLGESPARGLAKALSRPCVDTSPERAVRGQPTQTAHVVPLSSAMSMPTNRTCQMGPRATAPVLRLPLQPRVVCGMRCEPVTAVTGQLRASA